MREIVPLESVNAVVRVPGSKSYTHRMLIAAALSDGRCEIENALDSEDTALTLDTLRKWGVGIERHGDTLIVLGRAGQLSAWKAPIFLGNSGTSMRLLTALAALAQGRSILTGTERLLVRPIQDLLDGLSQLGVSARSLAENGRPPVEIDGGRVNGGQVALNCSLSSQFLSALLLIGPCTRDGLEVRVSQGPVSRPYIDITVDAMARFGVQVERRAYHWFRVPADRTYRSGRHAVEPDCSQAGYFWAAAAVTGSSITVSGISERSLQGDLRLLDILKRMGCRVRSSARGITVTGGALTAVEADMEDIPDVVPTVAVVAAFARGRTSIRNVAHLREKESDRLAAVCSGLGKMGIRAGYDENTLWVDGGAPHAAAVECHGDHRIAMSFAVAGLRTPGMMILDETCVQKSFPSFWEVFETLYP